MPVHDITRILVLPAFLAAASLAGCSKEAPKEKFETVPVERRDIVVSVEASGTVEPLLTVEIKSKASGEVLKAEGQTGDVVPSGTLLVQIDKRAPRNQLAQAESELEAAVAHRAIAKAQNDRAKKLFETRTINEVDYETTQLEYANSKADVVKAQVAVENARITLDDTDVRAPITGTIIEKLVETGQVISSPMKDFGGGTSLMKMADLSTVQVRALVDETDVGKIQPGKPVTVKVTAYPNQPFPGSVDKIEPQAKADQSVTTFAVLIRLPNPQGLLRPGMNADVEIRVAERLNALAVPTSTLRTAREVATMATEVGLDEATVRQQLAGDAGAPSRGAPGDLMAANGPAGGGAPTDSSAPRRPRGPPGDASATQGRSGGGPPDASAPRRPRGSWSGSRSGGWSGARGGRPGAGSYEYGGRYWTFVQRDGKPFAVNVETGLTNLDYNEVLSGLKEGDEVILLPSAGLLQAQNRQREQMRRFSALPAGGGQGGRGSQGQTGQQGGGGAPR
jgi:HlyD family secretion protein